MTISDELKNAIRESGFSLSELSRHTGLSRSIVSRFMNEGHGHRDIRLEEAADKLATFIGLHLVHDGLTIRKPDPKPQTIASRVRTVLAKNPAGLTRQQIRDQIVETNDADYEAIGAALNWMKRSGTVRHKGRHAVYKLAKKPPRNNPCSTPAATNRSTVAGVTRTKRSN